MKINDRVYLVAWPDYPGTVAAIEGRSVTVNYDNGEIGTHDMYDLEYVQ
jgi:hypothetical protein